MSDKFKVPGNASIFNFKNVYNAFVQGVLQQGFINKIYNPTMLETRGQSILGWSSGQVDLDTPNSVDPNAGTVTYTIPAGGSILQEAVIDSFGTVYTAMVDVTTDGELTIKLAGGAEDIGELDGSNLHTAEAIIDGDGVFSVSGRTRDNGPWSATRFFSIYNHTASPVEMVFRKAAVVIGDIALFGNNDFHGVMRWNDTSGNEFWELTTDNGQNWERVWTDDADFVARVGEVAALQTVSLIHQDNILAGQNVSIEAGVAPDGTTPTLTINSSGTGGGSGTGDWTREDVTYQSLLEQSDFKYSGYDTLQTTGTVILTGSASYTVVEDDFGSGRIQGSPGDGFETNNMIFEDATNIHSFKFHAVTDTDLQVSYATSNDGSTWSSWAIFDHNEVFIHDGFNFLKFRVEIVGAFGNIYSFGVFYGADPYSAGTHIGFRERFDVPAPMVSSDVITLPNDKWYHRDGISLHVFRNGELLTIGDDYGESNVGQDAISNEIVLNAPLNTNDVIIFEEYYGYVDVSVENAVKFQVDHYPAGAHKNQATRYVVRTTGSDNNDGSPASPWLTLDHALENMNAVGINYLDIEHGESFYINDKHKLYGMDIYIYAGGYFGGGSGPSAVVYFGASDNGITNSWGNIQIFGTTITTNNISFYTEDPSDAVLPDNTDRGFSAAGCYGKYIFENTNFILKGFPLFEHADDGGIVDISLSRHSYIQTIHGDRVFPIIDFNERLGGLYDEDTNFVGDFTRFDHDSVHGLVSGGSNIRTNVDFLMGYADETTGLNYRIAIVDGKIVLKPIL